MDNQQERLSLAWLAGIIDGEGTVSLTLKTPTVVRSPIVAISNYSPNIIFTAEEIIRRYTGCHIKEYPKQPGWRLTVAGMKRTLPLLRAVTPYLTDKKREAELMLEFIESRLSKTGKRSTHPHTERELEIARRITDLKNDRILRDYTPNPHYVG